MRKKSELKTVFDVTEAGNIGYAVYSSKNERIKVFEKKKNDMYMLVYADKGFLKGKGAPDLPQGCGIILAPDSEASFEAKTEKLTYTVTAEFSCKAEKMAEVTGKIFMFSDDDVRNLIFLKEAFLGENDEDKQLVKIYLELLLISFYKNKETRHQVLTKRYSEEEIAERVKQYLSENVNKKITFAQVVKSVNASATAVKTAFVKSEKMGVMTYFSGLKIEKAKRYIREGEYNFTQIAQLLAIDSPHRFTKLFKAKTGMTPTQYLRASESTNDEG